MKSLYTLLALFFGLGLTSAQELIFIEFKDKPNTAQYLSQPLTMLSQDALDRRTKRQVSLDARDVPLHEDYVNQIKTNFTILGHSKWLNGVVVNVNTGSEKDMLMSLSFVKELKSFVRSDVPRTANKPFDKFEENKESLLAMDSDVFIQQLNLQGLHQQGFTGKNVKLAVFDSGFWGVDVMDAFQYIRDHNRIKYTYDFVQQSTDIYSNNTHTHGTSVLSTIAAKTDNYTGSGYDADIYLFRTEYAPTETPFEMVHWVMAAERADSIGVDIINSSLGYYDFDDARYNYIHDDLDGQTSYITQGANIAVEKGIIVINAAGNERNNPWGKIITPADSEGVLSIGGVYANGDYTVFSSYGPTADGRIKPDLMAMGGAVPLYSYYYGEYFTTSNGTSFSSPIMAGAIASLIQDKEDFTIEEIKAILHQSADRYQNPDNDYGYGIPNFALAKDLLDDLKLDENFATKGVEVYPNPVKDVLHLKSASKIVLVEVFDVNGKKLISKKNTSQINLESFVKGGYLVKIKTEKGQIHQQKIIKH